MNTGSSKGGRPAAPNSLAETASSTNLAILWLRSGSEPLLDHNKRLVPLDYPLNARYEVIRYHEEAESPGKDRLVDPRVQ